MASLEIETFDGDGSFGAYLAEPAGQPPRRGGRDPGDLRGEPRHPPQMRPSRRPGLPRGGAGPVLAVRTQGRARPGRARPVPAGFGADGPARPGSGDPGHRGDDPRACAHASRTAARWAASAIASAAGSPSCRRRAPTSTPASAYYGVGLEGLLGEQHAIAHPLMLHIAGDGPFRVHRGAGEDPRGPGRQPPRDDPCLSRRGPRLRGGDGQAAERGCGAAADARTEAFFAENLR